jgi:hypothetical protein
MRSVFRRQPHPANPGKPVSTTLAPLPLPPRLTSLPWPARYDVNSSCTSPCWTGGCNNRVRRRCHSSPPKPPQLQATHHNNIGAATGSTSSARQCHSSPRTYGCNSRRGRQTCTTTAHIHSWAHPSRTHTLTLSSPSSQPSKLATPSFVVSTRSHADELLWAHLHGGPSGPRSGSILHLAPAVFLTRRSTSNHRPPPTAAVSARRRQSPPWWLGPPASPHRESRHGSRALQERSSLRR